MRRGLVRIDSHVAVKKKVSMESVLPLPYISAGKLGLLPDHTSSTSLVFVKMASWAPQPSGLQEILQTIHQSTDTQNADVQRDITTVSDFNSISFEPLLNVA